MLYQCQQSAEGLLLNNRAYRPLFPDNKKRYSGVMHEVVAYADQDVVMPDEVGNIPLQFPYAYQIEGRQKRARPTPIIDRVNHGRQAMCGPHFANANCQVVFAGGNVDQPLVAGVCVPSGTRVVSNTPIRQTQYALSDTHTLVMTNQKSYRNHLTFTIQHQNRQTTTCRLDGDITIYTPKHYQHHITDKLDEQLTAHHQRLIEA